MNKLLRSLIPLAVVFNCPVLKIITDRVHLPLMYHRLFPFGFLVQELSPELIARHCIYWAVSGLDYAMHLTKLFVQTWRAMSRL